MHAVHQFHGEERFEVSRERLWSFLTDLRNVPACVSKLERVEFPAPDTLAGKLASSFSFLRGSLDMTIQITERAFPRSRMTVACRGMGARATIAGTIEVPELPEPGALLKWQALAELDGLLGAVSKGLIEGAARKVIADTFESVRRQLVMAG
jgi:carbon monoxide dehydrogenase subunit G